MVTVPIIQLEHAKNLPMPAYATPGSAGLDLAAAVTEDIILLPLQRTLVPTGLCLELPLGFEGQVRPRSGLSYKHGLSIVNSPGTIDSDYRGEIKVVLINLGQEAFTITRGLRIAQLIIAKYEVVEWQAKLAINTTERGSQGFGSTGL